MVNQMYLDKANVLIEALPYIQRFNRKIIVIKYGGSAMVDEELKRNVIQDVVLLKLVGFKPIIVHGGGKEISRWVGKVGMEPKFVNGLRVTDADTMEVAEMVLNKVNKELVTMIQSLGVNAVGISGKDGGLLNVEKKLSKGEDIGFVGNINNVNPKVLYDLLDNDFLPVVCPVGMDDDFNTADAISAIFELVREINSAVSPNAHPTKALAEGCRALYLELSDVLGIPFSEKKDALTPEQEALFNARKDARKAKNWAESDRIRDELKAQGILVEDTPQGMKWKRI